MKTVTLETKLLSGFLAIVLVLGMCVPSMSRTVDSDAYAEDSGTMQVYYDFTEVKPASSRPSSITVGSLLLFAPTGVSKVSPSEAFLGLPSGCGLMKVDSLTQNNNYNQGTLIAHVAHPSNEQKTINTSVGFDGCNGVFSYYSDSTYWHYWCDGGGVKNKPFSVYKYTQATVDKSNLTARTTTKKEVSSTDIHIPKNELEVTLKVNGRTFNIDSSRWSFVDDKVNYVNNDRQITIQFGNVQASCDVEFYGQPPKPNAYKSVQRDSTATGNLKVGEKLHYDVKVTNEAEVGSIWKNVTITDKLPVGLELVPGSVNLARTKAASASDQIASIPLSSAKYKYDFATRTISLEIPYYVLNSQAYDLTYDLVVDGTAIAGGAAGGSNETRNLTNTVNVNGYDSDGKAYPCAPTACLPIPGETNPDAVKVEQVVPGSGNDPAPDSSKDDVIDYLEHSKTAQNVTDTREGAVTQVYDVIKYTMTMENTKSGSVFRGAQFVDQMPEGLEIVLGDAARPMSVSKTSPNEPDRAWSKTLDGGSYDAATRTLSVDCGDMFGGEKATLSFYAQVTADALGGDIGNVGTIQAAAPTVPGDESATEEKVDETLEATYPEPEKDKPTTAEVEKPVLNPITGEPMTDPETGEPITITVTETTGGVAAGDPEPKVEKTIVVVSKKDGVEVTDANKDVMQVGDIVRTTVVVSNLKEATEWTNVNVNDSCNEALDLVPGSVHVFDSDGNDVTDRCYKPDPDNPSKITLSFPGIKGGETYTLQYDAMVTGDAIDESSDEQPNIADKVEVVGQNPDPTDDKKATATDQPVNMARPGDPLDSVTKTMKVMGSGSGAVRIGDTVQYTVVAGNLADETTTALWPVIFDPLPEGVELSSDYVYVTKMDFNHRTQGWDKSSPSYVRMIARSNVYNESARTLVVPVGEMLNGSDRVCKGQTGYQVVFECKVTSAALAGHPNLGNIAYSESEKPSEQPVPAAPADPDDPDNPGTDPETPARPTYPTDGDGDIVNPYGDKVTDPEGNPIKPGDTKEDHPSIPDGVDIDDYIQNPGLGTTDPADPGRDPERPVYPVDEEGYIVDSGGSRVTDPEGNPIRNTDTAKDHPSIPDGTDLDEYIQQKADPIPGGYPTDGDGDVVQPVIDSETGNPVIDSDTQEPIYEKVTDIDGNPVKPDQTEVLEDLGIPKLTALHQVVKEVTKLDENGNPAGVVTYDSGKTGSDRVTTSNDTSFGAGDRVNTTVKVRNLVEGTRWAGAVVIDVPSSLVVTYYELVGPYGDKLSSWGDKGDYGGASVRAAQVDAQANEVQGFRAALSNSMMRSFSMSTTEHSLRAATAASNVAHLKYDGNQFRLSAAEIVGLEQYQLYYEGFVPEGAGSGNLEQFVEGPTSNNPLDGIKDEGPQVPGYVPGGAKLPEPTPQTPAGGNPTTGAGAGASSPGSDPQKQLASSASGLQTKLGALANTSDHASSAASGIAGLALLAAVGFVVARRKAR